ncbi:DUF2231 domain-containing protein [Ectobacillus polymachus]|uniref:DUF2231 domain-containing protein n=1 Tax=Ectobacillus polymachus TaxID=1508806 RepID=UPI003A8C79C3
MFQEITTHIHPILVHFPIALITVAVLYDVWIAWKKDEFKPSKGLALWIVVVISAWLAVWTGPEDAARGNTIYISLHSKLADLTALFVTLLTVYRIWAGVTKRKDLFKKFVVPYLVVSIASLILVYSVGYFGGKMVYSDGVGVKVNDTLVNPPK